MGAFTAAAGEAGATVFAASDALLAESTGVKSTNSHSLSKQKSIEVPEMTQNSTLRITFTLKRETDYTAYGQIYKNGAAVGAMQSTTSPTYVTKTEDIAGWDSGDEIQLYIRITSGVNDALTDNLSARGVKASTEDPEWEIIM